MRPSPSVAAKDEGRDKGGVVEMPGEMPEVRQPFDHGLMRTSGNP